MKYKRFVFGVLRSTRFVTRLLGKPILLWTIEHEDSYRDSLIFGFPWQGAAQTARFRGQFFNIRVHSRESAVLFFFLIRIPPVSFCKYAGEGGNSLIMAKLVLASCQFQIDRDVDTNRRSIERQMRSAAAKGAQLVHFSEACLSAYLGNELRTVREVNWDQVRASMTSIMALARKLRLWVVVGSSHPLSRNHKPHNSLYVVNAQGRLVHRYDKMFCTGRNERGGDLKHYSPGEAFVTFRMRNITCGLLICHDFRYPELFREYKKRGVQLMLVSFHNAGMESRDRYDRYKEYVTSTLQAAAASNYFAVSASNGTRRFAWPSFLVNAEGLIVSMARAHRPAVLINTIDTSEKLYDASRSWRDRSMEGIFHSGTLVRDPRSRDRESL